MKDFQGSLIFAMCLLALTAVVFFFKYGQEHGATGTLTYWWECNMIQPL